LFFYFTEKIFFDFLFFFGKQLFFCKFAIEKNSIQEKKIELCILFQILKILIFKTHIMKKILSLTSIIFLGIFLTSVSCVNEDSDNDEEIIDSLKPIDERQLDNTVYKLPSPIELYKFLHESKVSFNEEALNSIERKEKYNTSTRKAINLGIYSSDLAYSAVFEKTQETFQYFKTAKMLAEDLAISEGFNESVAIRIENNLENVDSLYEIASDAYWDATTFLEAEKKTELLSFIIIGSWVESVYIASSSVEKFSPKNPIVIRIAEQKLLLENLLDYLNSHEKNEEINKILRKLNELEEYYYNLYDGSNNINITEEKYNALISKIRALRNAFVY